MSMSRRYSEIRYVRYVVMIYSPAVPANERLRVWDDSGCCSNSPLIVRAHQSSKVHELNKRYMHTIIPNIDIREKCLFAACDDLTDIE